MSDSTTPTLPKNSTILIIRHAQKPDSGAGLTPAGRERALAYAGYFQSFSPDGGEPLKIDYLFAAANSSDSCRPQLTILPTAASLGLPIDDATPDDNVQQLAKQIRNGSQYDDSTLLICWHHEEALDLTAELGVDPSLLPPTANWPERWPGGPPPAGTPDVYGWVLIIVSDANGAVDTSRTRCINENLMADDAGKDPPNGTPAAAADMRMHVAPEPAVTTKANEAGKSVPALDAAPSATTAATTTTGVISACSDGSVYRIDSQGALYRRVPGSSPWTSLGGDARVIAAAPDGSVFGLDGNYAFEVYSNGSWQPAAQPVKTLSALSAGGASDVWGVDGEGVLHAYNGKTWTPQQPLPNADPATSVDVGEDGSCFALGASGNVYQLLAGPPQSWSPIDTPELASAIASAAAGWLWILGKSGQVHHWDGPAEQWAGAAPTPASLANLSCGQDGTLVARTGRGALYDYTLEPPGWTLMAALPTGAAADVSAAAMSAIYAADNDGIAYAYGPAALAWQQIQQEPPLSDVAAASGEDAWTIDGQHNLYRSEGQAWDPQPRPGVTLAKVTAAADGSVWGLDPQGKPQRHDPTADTWTPIACQSTLSAITCAASGAVLALDGDGVPLLYNGTATWPALEPAPPGKLTAITASADGTVLVIDDSQQFYIYLGSAGWPTLDGRALAISAAGESDIWTIDLNGEPVELTGGRPILEEGSIVRQPQGGLAPRWETENPFDETNSTHLWIVNRAAQLAGTDKQVGARALALVQPFAGKLTDPNSPHPDEDAFHNNLCQGLYDADFVDEYNDTVEVIIIPFIWTAKQATYATHFYDPDTGKNWLGGTFTAQSRGSALAAAALERYIAGDFAGAGYRLGLALHYYTDLTQPMHASNYTWLSSWEPGWHSDFETFVMEQQALNATPQYVAPETTDFATLYHAAAVASKKLRAVVVPSFMETSDYWSPTYRRTDPRPRAFVRSWIPALLANAVTLTAKLIVAWMRIAANALFTQPGVILCTASGQVLDWPKGQLPDLAVLQQFPLNGGINQQWTLTPLTGGDEGYYTITTTDLLSGRLALDVSNNATFAGSPVSAYTPNEHDNQKWKLLPTANGTFNIQCKTNAERDTPPLYLTVANVTQRGSGLTQDAVPKPGQEWSVTPFQLVTLTNVNSGLVADVKDHSSSAGAPVQQWQAYNGARNQQWLRVPLLASDEDQYFALISLNTAYVLDVQQQASGPQLIQQPWSRTPSQQWQFQPAAGGQEGAFALLNHGWSAGAMTVAPHPSTDLTANGELLQVAPNTGATTQQWTIAPAP